MALKKNISLITIGLVVLVGVYLVYSHFKNIGYLNLSSPEKTIRTYYKAFELSDFDLQKKTFADQIRFNDINEFNKIRAILLGYEILDRRVIIKKEYDFEQEGDVVIIVKEIYRNNEESIDSYILRKVNNDWLIIDWVTEDKLEEPLDEK